MNSFGFIHEKLDIKLLILYVLEKLSLPIGENALSELVLFDGGFNWFDYTECLENLVFTGQVEYKDNGLLITEKGRRNVNAVASALPYTVRARADRLVDPVAAEMRRAEKIETFVEPDGNGNFFVSLHLSDDDREMLSLRLSVPGENYADRMTGCFRAHAEKVYNRIIELLLSEDFS